MSDTNAAALPRGLLIRQLHQGDAASFRNLRLEALRLHPEAFGSSVEEEATQTEADFAARIPREPPDAIFGAFRHDGPAAPALMGMAGLYVARKLKARHKGVLWGMYVRPAGRGQGIGAALLARAMDHARQVARVEIVQLAVVTGNRAACALYDAAGFTIYGIERRALRLSEERYLDEELRALDLSAAPRG